jgi:glycosyltransferase involved in cell wall biosynthesis
VRIGMFADMYKPHISGVTNWISLYRSHLASLGHDVYVLTFGDRDFPDDEPNIVRSAGLSIGDTGGQFGFSFSAEAKRVISQLDIAHVHHPFQSGRMALRACRPLGIPVVFTNHTRYDLYSDVYARYVPRAVRMATLRSFLISFDRKVDLVMVPSASIEEWLREIGVDADLEVFPNAVDTRPFAEPPSPLSKADLGFGDGDVVLCFLGRLGEEKNLRFLMDAFVEAVRTEPRLALVLIGKGPLLEPLERQVEAEGLTGRVRFTGLVPYQDVPDHLAACDAFVSASVTEVHPLTIIESMAAGMPTLGVASPGVSDTVVDGVTGFTATLDRSEFAERMVELGDDELRDRLGNAAREEAAGYDVRIRAVSLLEHYERLVAERR